MLCRITLQRRLQLLSVKDRNVVRVYPPLYCEAGKHCVKRDGAKTPASISYRLTKNGHYIGFDFGCKYCEEGLPVEADAPAMFEEIVGITRKTVDILLICDIEGIQVEARDWQGKKVVSV